MKSLLILCLFLLAYISAITLDEAYMRCKGIQRSELEPCIVNLINEMKPLIQEGIKELGWDADSCGYDSHRVNQKDGLNYVQGHLYNAVVSGIEHFDLTYLKIDYENRLAIWSVVIPEVVQKGRYVLDAKLLQFPLYGNGTFWNRFERFQFYGVTKLEVVEINGEPHLQEKDTEVTMSYRKAAMRMNNLYDGNAIMQEAASAFLNMSLEVLLDEFKASAKGKFRQMTGNHVNEALSRIKLDDLAGSEFIKEAFSLNQ